MGQASLIPPAPAARCCFTAAREVASQARRLDQADAVLREAIAELRAAGLTVRDVARLLGATASCVSQIEQRGRGGAEGERPVG